MGATRPVYGWKKLVMLQGMKVQTLVHFLPELFSGKISLANFVRFLQRLLYFLKKVSRNKFFLWQGRVKLDLYIPDFGTPAFWHAARKFMTFGEKLPCSTVLLSVTKVCRFHCEHCYQRHDLGPDTEIATLIPVAQSLQDQGVAFFNIEGGDPFLRLPELQALCSSLDHRSEIWINSTGDGATREALATLKQTSPLKSVMFSMHSADPEVVNGFMRSRRAWSLMEEGIANCLAEGVAPAINTCIQKPGFYDGTFEAIMEQAQRLGVTVVQIIHPKPSGGWLDHPFEHFSRADMDNLKAKVEKYNHHRDYRNYPAIYAQALEEEASMYGCTAGGTDRFYINAKGDVQPCEFLHLSFGNIRQEPFQAIYQRMRDAFPSGHEDWLCEKYAPLIARIKDEEGLLSLPLSPELSQRVISQWSRGRQTDLYRKVEDVFR